MFLDPEERLILFHQRSNELSLESLCGFRDAGIKTVEHDARFCSWHEIEPVPGKYRWDILDRLIDKCREANLKSSIGVYWRAPDWLGGCINQERTAGTWWLAPDRAFPDSWRVVDPLNLDVLERELEFLHRVCAHYTAPDVMCRYAMYYGGERIMPFFSEYTEQQVIDTVLSRQRVFALYSDELWMSLHPFHADGTASIDGKTLQKVGNEHMWAVFDALAAAFPKHTIHNFVTEFFVTNTETLSEQVSRFNPAITKWVGAQFTKGVVHNARRLEDYGLWGMLMAHDWIYNERQPTAWDFNRTAEAVEILNDSLHSEL